MRAGAQCGEGRGLKPVKKKKNSLTNYETYYGNYDIDCLGDAFTVYGKWGFEIWSEQTAKSIFNKRKTVQDFFNNTFKFPVHINVKNFKTVTQKYLKQLFLL